KPAWRNGLILEAQLPPAKGDNPFRFQPHLPANRPSGDPELERPMSYSVNRESSKTYSANYQNQAKKDADAKAQAEGTPTKTPTSGGPSVPVLDKSGSYSADSGLGASTSGTGPGGVEYDAFVEGPKFEVDGNIKAEVGKDGVSIDVNVDI